MSPPDILLGGGDSLHRFRYALVFTLPTLNRMSSSPTVPVMNSVMADLVNSTNTIAANAPSTRPWVLILIVVALVLGGVFVFVQYSASSSPQQPPHSVLPEPREPQPEPAANTVPQGKTWCFVGEDVQGRWCIQVPSAHACDANRSFASEEDCKLVPASPMPLGIATRGDSILQPLGPIPAMSNTY